MRLVAVIGGGPAGMAAAYSAAKAGASVTLYESNEKLGKKLFISGKGRCNLTNDSPIENHMSNVLSNPRFLYSAYHAFSPQDLMDLIENAGVPLKTERGNRVFPVSDKSSDVISAWARLLQAEHVEVRLSDKVFAVDHLNEGFRIRSESGERDFDAVVICTGGVTYRATGSTGDGYAFARSFGHAVVDPAPSLVGIRADVPHNLAGLSLKNVELSCVQKGKVLFREFGEMLFTHSGISGPIVLTLSSRINRMDITTLTLSLDLKPALDLDTLDARLVREFNAAPNKSLRNVMPSLMPKSLISFVLSEAKIEGDRPCQSVTKTERKSLAAVIKGVSLKPIEFEDFNGAIITAGGVSVTEIDPKNMMSRFVQGLFFAGEVLDLDALTGGYNLQIAFSTGYLAGLHAANA